MFLTVCANPSVDSFWSVPSVRKGTTNRSRKETYYPGGKGLHTALALSELGQPVKTLGLWGGQTGQWLRQECEQRNIATFGPTAESWNRLCITLRSDSEWNETELLGQGPKATAESVNSFQQAFNQSIWNDDITAVIISGSQPLGFQDDFYGQLVEEAKKRNIATFVDASGSLLQQTFPARPFGIHINHKEGQTLSNYGDPADIARWLSEHCELAAVTAGADGLYMAFEKKLFHASYTIDQNRIFSTIGSGDCLLAGLCLAHSMHDNPEYWARFAVACGSANCLHQPLGMLNSKDVEDILPKVIVRNIKKS